VAQQRTDDEGAFDFIGIDEGSYVVGAEGNVGSTRKQGTEVGDGQTIELTLRLEPYRHVAALVMTPSGQPASGAVVRISEDGGYSWTDLFTTVEGRFDYDLDASQGALPAIILTHQYPALMTRLVPSDGPATLVLQRQGGFLRGGMRAFVGKGGAFAPLQMFLVPPSRNGIVDGAAYLEPGVYSVCSGPALDSRCQSITIQPGVETTLEMPQEEPAR
jgi:hypothetical protein